MTDLKALKRYEKGESLDQPTICQLALRGYVFVEEVTSPTSHDAASTREYRVTLTTQKGKRLLELA